jgi:hypothetical protein
MHASGSNALDFRSSWARDESIYVPKRCTTIHFGPTAIADGRNGAEPGSNGMRASGAVG